MSAWGRVLNFRGDRARQLHGSVVISLVGIAVTIAAISAWIIGFTGPLDVLMADATVRYGMWLSLDG